MRAVRTSTRTAPDVVLIGESRDPETLRGMIESAETGVAAYSTVHTRSVPETITRIINVFPFDEQRQIAATLLSSLRLIVNQRLLPRAGGDGRVALREFLAFRSDGEFHFYDENRKILCGCSVCYRTHFIKKVKLGRIFVRNS